MEFRVLNGTDVEHHFRKSLCSRLVKHPTELCSDFRGLIGKGKLTSFLEILPKKYDLNSSWPFTRTISVHLKDSPHQEIPAYLREYWIRYVKKEIEEFAVYPDSSSRKRRWRVIDTCGPALVSESFQAMEGFNVYFSRSFAFDPGLDAITQNIVQDRVAIKNPDELGKVLNFAKQFYLRHQFYEQGRNVEITVGHVSQDKSEKVFLIKALRDNGRTSNYIVKFDHPRMIASEKANCDLVHEALKEFNRNELLPYLYTIEKYQLPSFGEKDILGIIASEAVGPDWPSERLTLRAVWATVTASQVKRFFSELEPVFLLLEQVVNYAQPQFKKTSLQLFYQEFFKKLYGFVVSKEYIQFQSFLPAIRNKPVGKSLENITSVSIRRIKLDDSKDGKHVGMSIHVEDSANQRIILKFRDFASEITWPHTFAKSGLADEDKLHLDSNSLEPDVPAWHYAVEKIHSRMKRCLTRPEDLLNYENLTFLNSLTANHLDSGVLRELPNPIWFFVNLSQNTKFCEDTKEFEWVSTQVHFDLHLDNILAPINGENNNRTKPTLIDLASMQRGPMEYDYARMEVRLVLDRFGNEKWFEQDIGSELNFIVGFHNALRASKLDDSMRAYRKEIGFIKRLRLMRSQIADRLNNSGRVVGIIRSQDVMPLYACLFFEYLSELFVRSSSGRAVTKDLLWAFVSASYYLSTIRDHWDPKNMR